MAYYFYLGNLLLPIAPPSLKIKINNQNKTVNLVNHGEVNILKKAGLTDVSFEARIPQVEYPYATYSNGFQNAKSFLDKFEQLKTDQEPFQFIVSRTMPDGKVLFNTNMTVSMEEYSIDENASDGFDLVVPMELKQFKDFGVKKITIKEPIASSTSTKPKATVKKSRPTTKSPAPKKKPKSHTVKRGDTLWAISKKYYGKANWDLIGKIQNANSQIKNPNLIYPGQKFTIPVLET